MRTFRRLLGACAVSALAVAACTNDYEDFSFTGTGGSAGGGGAGTGGGATGGTGGGVTGGTGGGVTGGTGGGVTGGTGGGVTGGTGGTTGGTGGTSDAGTDQSLDSPADVGSDSPGDAGDAEASLPAHCSNTQKDADETDVDCGGKDCAGCDTGKVCAVATDCASKKCNSTNKICDPPLCTDGIKNGNESDTDCGGANCPLCADTKTCNTGNDCASGVCSGAPKTCQVPNCSDNVKNGNEGDKDCGGTCPSKCSLGQSCKAAADCGSNVCTTSQCKCPAGMALVAATGGGSYCIDQLEVSYEQYETFWQAGPTFNLPACSWNTSYTPTSNWPASSSNKKKPVRNVDWCDAWAYCQWAGKRLCGKQNGGAVAYTDFANSNQSQWMNACTAGVNTYPYGSAFVAGNCVGQGYAFPDAGVGPQDVNRSANNCLGAAPGLYDMSGNVAEWEDSCNGTTGTGDDCRVRGGSYSASSADMACNADRALKRDAKLDDVGFRCCFP